MQCIILFSLCMFCYHILLLLLEHLEQFVACLFTVGYKHLLQKKVFADNTALLVDIGFSLESVCVNNSRSRTPSVSGA